MTLFDFRPSRATLPEIASSELGGDYLEYDDLLASGDELRLEEDSGGYLVLIEGGETE